jgi:hypothetical protein
MATKVSNELAEDQAGATLVIGNSYTYKGQQFLYGVEKPVSLDLAKELEELELGSTDSRSKKRIAQARFEIRWPEGYSPEDEEGDDEDDKEKKGASSGAKRPAKRTGITKKPTRASRS